MPDPQRMTAQALELSTAGATSALDAIKHLGVGVRPVFAGASNHTRAAGSALRIAQRHIADALDALDALEASQGEDS